MKKNAVAILALLGLSACNLTKLPEDPRCPEGTVLHTSPAGVERCIRPGMGMLPGAIEGTVLGVAAVAAL